MVPNIFDYATKELSQDALICWLVACARDADGELRALGLDFVRALMRAGERTMIDTRNDRQLSYDGDCEVVEVLCGPKQQYGKIDVYFLAAVDGNRVSFLIEDKTHTEMHGNQLERYRGIVARDEIEEKFVKAVYLKTGYVFDDEREKAEHDGYAVFDAENMLAFLDGGGRSGAHEIVSQYADYMTAQVDRRRKAVANWDLDEGFVQWKFMVRLGKVLQLSKPKWPWPGRWFNIGGGAWTQYPHWEDRGALYWRLDSWKPLRLMVDTSKAGDHILDRWDGWSRAFEHARMKAGLCAGKFRSVRSRSGAVVREGTIGAVEIAGCLKKEGLDNCVARVERLHRKFVAAVGDEL